MVDRYVYQVYTHVKKSHKYCSKRQYKLRRKIFRNRFLVMAKNQVRTKIIIHKRSFRDNTTFDNCQESTATFYTMKFILLSQKYHPGLQYKNLTVF